MPAPLSTSTNPTLTPIAHDALPTILSKHFPPPPPPPQPQTGTFASLYLICPKHNKQYLNNLILNSPSATPTTLFATVQAWYTSNSIQDNAPTVTTNTTNEP